MRFTVCLMRLIPSRKRAEERGLWRKTGYYGLCDTEGSVTETKTGI